MRRERAGNRVGRVLLTMLLMAAFIAGGCAGSDSAPANDSGEEGTGDEVLLQLDFLAAGYHAPFVMAVDRGYYAERGLNVRVAEGTGSSATAQLVANGSVTFGFVDLGTAMQLISQGAPIRAISVIVQRSPLSFLTLADSGITRPQQLTDRSIGQVAGGANAALVPVFLDAVAMATDDVRLVNLPAPSLPQSLADGSVDAIVGISNFHLPLLEIGLEASVNRMDMADYGPNLLSFSLITSDSLLERDRDRVRDFVEASLEGWQYAANNQNESIQALRERFTELDEQVATAQLKETLALLHTERTEGEPLGVVAAEDVLETEQVLVQAGLIASATGEPDRYVVLDLASS